MMMKRYFAVVWPKGRSIEAALITGAERDGKVITSGKRIGFAVDYYPDEARDYCRSYGSAIIGDYGTRRDAEEAICKAFSPTQGEKR
jgi:hypothetical protein